MKIKFCGFTREIDYQKALDLGADYAGFVFYPPSPRYVDPKKVGSIIKARPSKKTKTVGVFVNASANFVEKSIEESGVNLLQFHGKETPSFAEQFSMPYWKVFFADQNLEIGGYENAEAFLIDYFHPQKMGGSGKSFDWKIVEKIASTKPLFVAGGINVGNIDEALRLPCAGLDVASGIEKQKGIKDFHKMEEIMKKVRGSQR